MASNTAPKQYHPDALPLQAIYLGAAVVTGAGEGGELRLEVAGGMWRISAGGQVPLTSTWPSKTRFLTHLITTRSLS